MAKRDAPDSSAPTCAGAMNTPERSGPTPPRCPRYVYETLKLEASMSLGGALHRRTSGATTCPSGDLSSLRGASHEV